MVPATIVIVDECYALVVGMVHEGITLYGPFDTFTEATQYGNKNHCYETRGVVIMRKETEKDDQSTSDNTGVD